MRTCEQGRRRADSNRGVERLRGAFHAVRHEARNEPHAGKVEQREGEAVKRLHQRERKDIGGLRHHRPAEDAASAASTIAPRGVSRATSGGPIKKKTSTSEATESDHSTLADARADPGRGPADHGKRIVHRMAAEDHGRHQDHVAEKRNAQRRKRAHRRRVRALARDLGHARGSESGQGEQRACDQMIAARP